MTASPEVGLPELLARVSAVAPTKTFNPVALLVRRETDLSRLIGWMLDPRGSHGAGPAFLASFLRALGLGAPSDLHLARVDLEATRRVRGKIVGRIDIQVEHPGFTLLLENKPVARFGDEQLQRYADSLVGEASSGHVVALVGRGWTEAGLSAVVPPGARAVRLGVEVRDWVGECAAAAGGDRLGQFLAEFRDDLHERHGGMREAALDKVVDELIGEPGLVEAAMTVMLSRERFAERMSQDFAARVAALADAKGVGRLRPLPGDAPLFGGNKNGTLRLDVGLEEFDVALEAEATGFRDVSFSVSSRRKISRIGRVHAALVGRLRGALGPGAGQDLVDWYAWWDWVDALHPSGIAPADAPALWAWAADPSDEGLAARFVARAGEIRQALAS